MADQDYSSDFEINDSDTETTSASSAASDNFITFDPVQPVVLELHEIRKDSASPPPPQAPLPPETEPAEARIKKLRKKKRPTHSEPQNITSSTSQIHPRSDTTEDEFFDAQGSLHLMPENQAKKPTAAALQPLEMSPPSPPPLPPAVPAESPPTQGVGMRSSSQVHPPALAPPVVAALPLIPTSQSESTVPTAPVAQPPLPPAQSDHGPGKGSHTTTSQSPSSVERQTAVTKPTKKTE